jgi:hypothetical protein
VGGTGDEGEKGREEERDANHDQSRLRSRRSGMCSKAKGMSKEKTRPKEKILFLKV